MESDNTDRHAEEKNDIADDTIQNDQNKHQQDILLDDNDTNFLAGFDIVDDDEWEDQDNSTIRTPSKENEKEHNGTVRTSQERPKEAGRHVSRNSNSVISKRSADSNKHSSSDKKIDQASSRKNLKDRDLEYRKKKDEDHKKTSKDKARSSSVSSKRKQASSNSKHGEGTTKVSTEQKVSPHLPSRHDKDKTHTSPKEARSTKKVSPQRKESPHPSSRCDKSVRDSKSDDKSSKFSKARQMDAERHIKLKESEKSRSIERTGDKTAGRNRNVESVSDRLREPKRTHRDMERQKDNKSEESRNKNPNVRDMVRRLSPSPKRKRRSYSPIRDRNLGKKLLELKERHLIKRSSAMRTGILSRDRNRSYSSKTSSHVKTSIHRRPTGNSGLPPKSRIPSASRISPPRKKLTIAERLCRRRRRLAGAPKAVRQEREVLLKEIIDKLNDTRSVRLQPVMMVPVPHMNEPHSQQNLLYLPPYVKSTSNVPVPVIEPSLRPDRISPVSALSPYQHEQAFFGGSPSPNCPGFSSQRLLTVSNQSLGSARGTVDSPASNFPRNESLVSRSNGNSKLLNSTDQKTSLMRSTKLYDHYVGLSKRSGAPDMSDNSSSHPGTSTLPELMSVKLGPNYSPMPSALSTVRNDAWRGRSSATHRRDASTRNHMVNCSRCGASGVTRDCSCGMPASSTAHSGRKLSRK